MGTEAENPNLNLFMVCRRLNRQALRELPAGFRLRHPRRVELPLWMRMPFDGQESAEDIRSMEAYYNRVYAPEGDLFFRRCLFVVDDADVPVGTLFAWRIHSAFTTLHWFKVLPGLEGRGIGRGLLSTVMTSLAENEYPVYLHTQLGSLRAIKLYSDFGFHLLLDEAFGPRHNDLQACLPVMAQRMPAAAFNSLCFDRADPALLSAIQGDAFSRF